MVMFTPAPKTKRSSNRSSAAHVMAAREFVQDGYEYLTSNPELEACSAPLPDIIVDWVNSKADMEYDEAVRRAGQQVYQALRTEEVNTVMRRVVLTEPKKDDETGFYSFPDGIDINLELKPSDDEKETVKAISQVEEDSFDPDDYDDEDADLA